MKQFIKMSLIMVLFLPILIFAKNYNDAKNYAENIYIKSFMNPDRYLVTTNSGEVKGNLITVDDFKKTMLGNSTYSSYLFDGTKYWADAKNIIGDKITQSNGSDNLKLRVAENVKHKTRVKGNGRYSTPWIFVDQYNVTVTAVNARGTITSLLSNPQEVGTSVVQTVSEGATAKFKITAADEFKYMSNNCGADSEYNSDTEELTIKNISKDMSCDVTFTQSSGSRSLATPHQLVQSKIIGTVDRVFTAPSPSTFFVSKGVGYFRDGNLNVRVGVLNSVPHRKGWNFYGYTVNGTTFIDGTGAFKTDKTELFVKNAVITFLVAPKEYTIRLNPNGGTNPDYDTYTIPGKVKYEHDLPDVDKKYLPTKLGYTLKSYVDLNGKQFLGYNVSTGKATAAGNVWETDNETIEEHTLYAQWDPNTCKFAYDYSGGSKGTYAPTSVKYDQVATISNPLKTGYLFTGWTISGHNTTTAKTGSSSSNVSNPISGTPTNEYFKNLNPTNDATVNYKANWTPKPLGLDINPDFNNNGANYANGARVQSFDLRIVSESGEEIYKATGLTDYCSAGTCGGTKSQYNATYYITNVRYKSGFEYAGYSLRSDSTQASSNVSGVTVGSGGTSFTFKHSVDGDMWFSINTKAIFTSKDVAFVSECGKQEFVVPATGTYKIELWGAQGSGGGWEYGSPAMKGYTNEGGKGAYVSGEIYLTEGEVLNFYIGESPNDRYVKLNKEGGGYKKVKGGCNGGGNGLVSFDPMLGAGGGATDVRYGGTGLKNRIMVAGGGGGASGGLGKWSRSAQEWHYHSSQKGGKGGGLKGGDGAATSTPSGKGGTQTAGGEPCGWLNGNAEAHGSFGKGGGFSSYNGNGSRPGNGGGGGYYGGGEGYHYSGAGGGSSFISGYKGCIAVKSDGKPRCDSGSSVTCATHFSGKVFTNGSMTAGAHSGHGKAKITLIN